MMNDINRIQFEVPDLEALTTEYTVVDLHFHTRYSDGLNHVDAIAARARQLGIGIAITDHNEIQGALEMEAHPDLLTIPGIEITSREGSHVLVYFYETEDLKTFFYRDIRPYRGKDVMSSIALSMEEIIMRARMYKALIIFPHPYCAAYTGICNVQFSKERLLPLFDASDGVEVINSENLKKWNLRCAVLGFNLNKAITGGSDGHTLYHMGKVVSYARCESTRQAFLDAVKNRETKVIGKEINLFRKVTTNGLKLKTNIKNYHDLFGKNIRYSRSFLNAKSRLLAGNVRRGVSERLHRKESGLSSFDYDDDWATFETEKRFRWRS